MKFSHFLNKSSSSKGEQVHFPMKFDIEAWSATSLTGCLSIMYASNRRYILYYTLQTKLWSIKAEIFAVKSSKIEKSSKKSAIKKKFKCWLSKHEATLSLWFYLSRKTKDCCEVKAVNEIDNVGCKQKGVAWNWGNADRRIAALEYVTAGLVTAPYEQRATERIWEGTAHRANQNMNCEYNIN